MAIAIINRNRARGWVRRAQRFYVRMFRSYGPDELCRALASVGVVAGDQLMLHSALDERCGFRAGANGVIDSFLRVLGPAGGLYMVSMPYQSSTAAYLRDDPVFDVRRTASRMGLISEFFRKRPGVLRSVHPTHPVLGHGAQAAAVLAGHESCAVGCGPGSPFEGLLQRDGKVAFFNVSLDYMTYFHYLEHLVAPQLPFPLYDPAPVQARLIDAGGAPRTMEVRVYSEEALRRRRPGLLHGWLDEAGLVRQVRVGATTIRALGLRDVTDLVLARAARGEFFYAMAE